MTAPVIPNGLKPFIHSYGIGDPGGVMRTPVSGGRPRYGLDYDRGTQQFNVTLVLTSTRFNVWSAFYHHIIKKGAISFEMMLDSGTGPDTHLVNIVPGSYSATRAGGVATAVTFIAEAESKVYDMTADEAQSMIDIYNGYGDGTDALLDRLAQYANVDTLVLDF